MAHTNWATTRHYVAAGWANGLAPATFFCAYRPQDVSTTKRVFGLANSVSSTSDRVAFQAISSSAQASVVVGGSTTSTTSNPSLVTDTWMRYLLRITPSAIQSIGRNEGGSKVSSTSVSHSRDYSGFGNIYVGAISGNHAGASSGLAEFAAWTVDLTTAEHDALLAGVSPGLIRPGALWLYVPLIRDMTPVKFAGTSFTRVGTALNVEPHPRIYL